MSVRLRTQGVELSKDDGELREELSRLEGALIIRHAGSVERLRPRFKHEIRFVELLFGSRCGPFALGISNEPAFSRLCLERGLQLDRKCWAWLIHQKLELAKPMADGALAVYFDGPAFTHAGRVAGGKVLSKWGIQPTYLHPLEQVPAHYGDTVFFFDMPAPADVLDWLEDYAEGHGIPAGADMALQTGRPRQSLQG